MNLEQKCSCKTLAMHINTVTFIFLFFANEHIMNSRLEVTASVLLKKKIGFAHKYNHYHFTLF